MQKALIIKLAIIMVIVLILTGVLTMINGVVLERESWRDQAYNDIAASLAGDQRLTGPVMIIPYNETTKYRTENSLTHKIEEKTNKERRVLYLLPENLDIDGKLKTEERHRGIYQVPTYSADMNFKGKFVLPKSFNLDGDKDEILWKEAFVWISVGDNRGISSHPVLDWAGEKFDFVPGAEEAFPLKSASTGGISANLSTLSGKPGEYSFSFNLGLVGTRNLDWVPSAKDMSVRLTADWPSPSFSGRFLPAQRQVSEKGFTADWKISNFASNAEDLINSCEQANCQAMWNNSFGVQLITPDDTYQQTDRAVKYGMLFISLTFVTFFLFETMKRLPIHPIQYGLVGVALALFFQLLISLSEQMEFILAYAIAASACVLLLGVYVSAVLKSVKRGAGFAAGLSVLYATLYGLLQSEDNALLLGSVLIFAVLAAIMILTRKVDWYKVGLSTPPNQ